jgi:hypothetical protein
MVNATIGKGFDVKICEKLGLDPKRVNRIVVTILPKDIVMLDVKIYATVDDMEDITNEICHRLEPGNGAVPECPRMA